MAQTLLLADDSVTIQRVIELTFADENIEVVAVSDGNQAIRRIDANPPDIVLADVGMPGPTGYEVARHIKRSPRLAHIPVLLLTGAFEPVDQDKAAEAGCDGILAKPFEPQLVIARVKELLGAPSEPEPSAPPPPVDAAPERTERIAELDNYFEHLDQAFSTLGGSAPAGGNGSEDVGVGQEANTDPAARVEPESMLPALPPLADAFAALLAAEQQPGAPPRVPWPPAPGVSDDLVNEVVARVLAQLSDQIGRQQVADVVARVADRLVREEIERIKASIK